MRALLIFIAAIVVIILGLWATLVLYFDEARLKQIATEQVRAQTGRELVIDGPLKLDFFPGVSLVASDVSLSGPDNYSGPDFFKADEFSMSLSLLPLLSGTVETGDVGLEQAELNLYTDGAGISSLDGLVSGEPDAEAGQTDVSTGEILLTDIRLNVTDVATDSRQVFVVKGLASIRSGTTSRWPLNSRAAWGSRRRSRILISTVKCLCPRPPVPFGFPGSNSTPMSRVLRWHFQEMPRCSLARRWSRVSAMDVSAWAIANSQRPFPFATPNGRKWRQR